MMRFKHEYGYDKCIVKVSESAIFTGIYENEDGEESYSIQFNNNISTKDKIGVDVSGTCILKFTSDEDFNLLIGFLTRMRDRWKDKDALRAEYEADLKLKKEMEENG